MQFPTSFDKPADFLLPPSDPLLADMKAAVSFPDNAVHTSVNVNEDNVLINVKRVDKTFRESCTRTTGRMRVQVKLLQVGLKGQQSREKTHAEVMRAERNNKAAFGRKMPRKAMYSETPHSDPVPVVDQQQDRL